MKHKSQVIFLSILSIVLITCSDDPKMITDDGIIFQVQSLHPPENPDIWFGLVGYDPNEVLAFAGQDSIALSGFPDGRYKVGVKLFTDNDAAFDYVLTVSGLFFGKTFTFPGRFEANDKEGTVRTQIIVEKTKRDYVIK